MEDLYGTYRGFTPTDESAVGMGEIRVVIDSVWLTITIAGGLDLTEDNIAMLGLRKMTTGEIAADFEDGASIEGVQGIIAVEATPQTVMDCMRLLFLPALETDKDSEEHVILRGLFAEEVFGPSILFTPSQLAAGRFEEAIVKLEEFQGESGVVPLIENDGKAACDNNIMDDD